MPMPRITRGGTAAPAPGGLPPHAAVGLQRHGDVFRGVSALPAACPMIWWPLTTIRRNGSAGSR